MSGHRRSAVALHGLNVHDRQWMLAQLPTADQQILQQYLNELDALGFEYGPDLTQELNDTSQQQAEAMPLNSTNSANLANSAPPWQTMQAVRPLSALEQVQQASAQQIHACLAEEPASVVARLLAQHEWAWQDALLAQMSALARQRVRSLLAETLLPAPLLDDFLLNAVAGRLREPVFSAPNQAQTKQPASKKSAWFGTWGMQWKR
jgi:hypothetical protein